MVKWSWKNKFWSGKSQGILFQTKSGTLSSKFTLKNCLTGPMLCFSLQEYTSLVEKLCKKCKEQLCLYIHQAVNTSEWFLLSSQMQKDIMDGRYCKILKGTWSIAMNIFRKNIFFSNHL